MEQQEDYLTRGYVRSMELIGKTPQKVGHLSQRSQRRNMSFRATAEYQKIAKNHIITVSAVPGIDRLHSIEVNEKGSYDPIVCRCDVGIVTKGSEEFPPGAEEKGSVVTIELPRDQAYKHVVVMDPSRDAILTVCDVVKV